GFLYDDFKLTLQPGHREEALGPFFYSQQSDTETTWGLPPVFDHVSDPAVQLEEYDIGFPVLTYRRFGKEGRWQFFQVLSWATGQNQQEQEARRFSLFPFYF